MSFNGVIESKSWLLVTSTTTNFFALRLRNVYPFEKFSLRKSPTNLET
jgi:hypothetical protein